MKLFDVAKGLLKKIIPAIPQITHRKPTRTQPQRETQVKRPAPAPETHTRPAPIPIAEQSKRSTQHRQPEPAPKPRTPSGTAEERFLKGRSKPKKRKTLSPFKAVKDLVNKVTGSTPNKAPKPSRGRPKGATDKKPRKPRETVKPREWGYVELPPKPPTALVEDEEPAKGELNVIEWLREQASWADNTFTVALIMREIEGAIDREGFGEFCERISINAINFDVDLAFFHSDAVDVYNGAMSLAALIGFNLNEDELFDAFVEDELKNIDRVFSIKAFT